MSIVFEDFEEFLKKLIEWRKRESFTLDSALSIEINLETLLAELPIQPFDEFTDENGPWKNWGGYSDGKPFYVEFSEYPNPSVDIGWRETGWPDEPFAWSFLNQIKDFPVQLIRPGCWIRSSWDQPVESIYLEGPNPYAEFPFPYEWEFYRSGSREETEGLLSFLSDCGWEVNWRIGPPVDQEKWWYALEIQPDRTQRKVAFDPMRGGCDASAWKQSFLRPDSKFLVFRVDEKDFGIGVKNGQPIPDWPPKPSE